MKSPFFVKKQTGCAHINNDGQSGEDIGIAHPCRNEGGEHIENDGQANKKGKGLKESFKMNKIKLLDSWEGSKKSSEKYHEETSKPKS